jgi:hypothetical protein
MVYKAYPRGLHQVDWSKFTILSFTLDTGDIVAVPNDEIWFIINGVVNHITLTDSVFTDNTLPYSVVIAANPTGVYPLFNTLAVASAGTNGAPAQWTPNFWTGPNDTLGFTGGTGSWVGITVMQWKKK